MNQSTEPILRCRECDREFDLLDEDQADEWYYGHDCEGRRLRLVRYVA